MSFLRYEAHTTAFWTTILFVKYCRRGTTNLNMQRLLICNIDGYFR